MTLTTFSWSDDQANRFRDHVVQREELLLGQLATWMRSTGGPIDQMDATMESLKPYWKWFVRFCDDGLPGVPQDAKPSMWDPSDPAPDVTWYDRVWPVLYAAQAVDHYLRSVIEHVDPPARWAVYKDLEHGSRNIDHNATGIALWGGQGDVLNVGRLRLNLSARIVAEPHQRLYLFERNIEESRQPDRLFRSFSSLWGRPIRSQERGPSILSDMPETPTTGPFPTRNEILGSPRDGATA